MNVVTQAATLEDAVNASPSPNQPFFPRKKNAFAAAPSPFSCS
jgi:glucose/mannose transport system permease protein